MENTCTNKEYHANGSIAYTEHIVIIPDGQYCPRKYPNIRVKPDGTRWIRTGLCAKYHDNGIMAWGIFYDDFGNVEKTYPSHRADGSVIQY